MYFQSTFDQNFGPVARTPSRLVSGRRGLTTLEVTVSASLLAASLAVLMPMSLSAGKLWQETRQLRMASDALMTQLDLLTHIAPEQIAEYIQHIQLGDELKRILPGAKFTHRITDEDKGVRIELSLDWEHGHPSKPMTLVGWNNRRAQGVQR